MDNNIAYKVSYQSNGSTGSISEEYLWSKEQLIIISKNKAFLEKTVWTFAKNEVISYKESDIKKYQMLLQNGIIEPALASDYTLRVEKEGSSILGSICDLNIVEDHKENRTYSILTTEDVDLPFRHHIAMKYTGLSGMPMQIRYSNIEWTCSSIEKIPPSSSLFDLTKEKDFAMTDANGIDKIFQQSTGFSVKKLISDIFG